MQYDHLTFPEAVERVAKRYGIDDRTRCARRRAQRQGDREKLYRVNERAAANYQSMLFSPSRGKAGVSIILKQRGVDEATARKFMLGYAPQTGSGLLEVIKQEKLSLQDALKPRPHRPARAATIS